MKTEILLFTPNAGLPGTLCSLSHTPLALGLGSQPLLVLAFTSHTPLGDRSPPYVPETTPTTVEVVTS